MNDNINNLKDLRDVLEPSRHASFIKNDIEDYDKITKQIDYINKEIIIELEETIKNDMVPIEVPEPVEEPVVDKSEFGLTHWIDSILGDKYQTKQKMSHTLDIWDNILHITDNLYYVYCDDLPSNGVVYIGEGVLSGIKHLLEEDYNISNKTEDLYFTHIINSIDGVKFESSLKKPNDHQKVKYITDNLYYVYDVSYPEEGIVYFGV